MAFIKKNWQKDASKNGVGLLMQIGGAAAGAYFSTKVAGNNGSNTSETLKNLINPGMLAVGALGALMFENEHLKNFSSGFATIAALKAVAVMAPDTAGKSLGLSGVEPEPELTANLMGMGTLTETTETYTGEELPELAETAPQSDGNDWNAVADQIDYEQTIQTAPVNGIDDDETANLMGFGDIDTDDETANLMGMF